MKNWILLGLLGAVLISCPDKNQHTDDSPRHAKKKAEKVPAWDFGSDCLAPVLCRQVQTTYIVSSQDPTNEKKFLAFLAYLKQTVPAKCKIQGVNPLVAAYRACHDTGSKVSNGEVVKNPFRPENTHDEVLQWFLYAKGSKFEAGPIFTSSDEFHSSLDGAWAAAFVSNDD